MKRKPARQTPFDEGVASVNVRKDAPNPYLQGAVEFDNFELGRAYALRSKEAGQYPWLKPATLSVQHKQARH